MMRNYLTIRNFKYFDLNLTLFNIFRYQKKMKLNLIHLNVLNLISSSSFVNRDVFVQKNKIKLFFWDDILSGTKKNNSLNDHHSFHLQKQMFMSLRVFIFRQINSYLFSTNELAAVSLPSKKQIFTLLRSPHTDKKSREQFRKREYKKIINMSLLFSDHFLKFLAKKECITSKIRSRYVDHS